MRTARRPGAASTLIVVGLAVSFGLACLAAPKWIEAAGLDVWTLPTLQKQLEAEAKGGNDLTYEIEESKRRVALKEKLIANLRAGETTLKEVVTEFLSIDQTQSDTMFLIRATYPGATDEEKMARNVLNFVLQRQSESPAKEAEISARLLKEMREIAGDPAVELN